MKGITALTKINNRTKQLKKKHPGKKYSTLRKQATSEYNAGKLPKARKPKAKKKKAGVGKRKYKVTHRVKKVGTTKRKTAHRKRPARAKARTRPRVTATKVRTRTVTKYRRVGAPGRKTNYMPLLVGGALLLGGILLLSKDSSAQTPPLQTTGNYARDTAASNILNYATAASLGVTALTNLINAINSMSDSEVITTAAQVQASGGSIPPALVSPPTGGPSINIGY